MSLLSNRLMLGICVRKCGQKPSEAGLAARRPGLSESAPKPAGSFRAPRVQVLVRPLCGLRWRGAALDFICQRGNSARSEVHAHEDFHTGSSFELLFVDAQCSAGPATAFTAASQRNL